MGLANSLCRRAETEREKKRHARSVKGRDGLFRPFIQSVGQSVIRSVRQSVSPSVRQSVLSNVGIRQVHTVGAAPVLNSPHMDTGPTADGIVRDVGK